MWVCFHIHYTILYEPGTGLPDKIAVLFALSIGVGRADRQITATVIRHQSETIALCQRGKMLHAHFKSCAKFFKFIVSILPEVGGQ